MPAVRRRRHVTLEVLGTAALGAVLVTACTPSTAPGRTGQAAPATLPPTVMTTRPGLTTTAVPGPAFVGSVTVLSPTVRARMTGHSWRPGCPVGLDDLRLLTMSYWGFDQLSHVGSMVVRSNQADAVVRVFRYLFAVRYPIRRMQPVDDFGADDDASMAADNTSAFNCRGVDGSPGVWSEHSYGWAIDVNPVENPWVRGTVVQPPAGAAYLDRSAVAAGMIHAGDVVVDLFASIGWTWGGTFRNARDYQHFSASGR